MELRRGETFAATGSFKMFSRLYEASKHACNGANFVCNLSRSSEKKDCSFLWVDCRVVFINVLWFFLTFEESMYFWKQLNFWSSEWYWNI